MSSAHHTQPTRLVRELKELDDTVVGCMRCGLCQAVCPVFGETGREADVARGKLALIEALASEILGDARGANERLNRCLLCGTCQAACPSGVRIMDVFLRARSILTGYLGLSPVKRAIFRGMLVHPGFFDGLMALAGKFQGLAVRDADPDLGSSCARFSGQFTPEILRDRHFKKLAPSPLHKLVPGKHTPPGKSGLTVALFTGCMIDKVYPEVGQAVLKVLNREGVGVFLPEGQACCGIPALASGDRDTFDRLVELNMERFAAARFDYLVTACATCTSTMAELWPSMHRARGGFKHSTRGLAERTMDISVFLTDVLGVKPREAVEGEPVTYHDPCHLKNALGVTRQPRDLIRASGFELREMEGAGTCCGCGGSFNLAHYDISKRIGRRKAEAIAKSGARIAATSCPACMLQITDMLSKRKEDVRVRHVIELFAGDPASQPSEKES